MRTLLLLLGFITLSIQATAQCGTCTPDPACVVSPAYPSLCPSILPDAAAGEAYQADVTFYTPHEFYDPDNGVDVVFNQVQVTGTTGLPFGMSIELNEPTGTYLPGENEHGCARVCGTPLSPGEYNISINIAVSVHIPSFGIDVTQNQAFELELTVLPGSGGNNSFDYDVNVGCDSLWVNFEALLDAAPNPTAWNWDFGNGETSDLKLPPSQFYSDTGSYEVTLETQFLEYVVTDVNITSVNGNWCGDAEEPTCDGFFGLLPDLYVQIRDANGILLYQSGVVNDVLAASWSGLSVVALSPPFTIQVWDSDAITSDDDLGTFSFNITQTGTINFSGAGGTSGSLSVSTQVGDTFVNSETITVYPSPSPVITYDDLTGVLSANTDSTFVTYTWYYNNEVITGQTGSQITVTAPGEYYVVVQNGFGCLGESDVFALCPDPSISYNDNNGILTLDGTFATYQWFYEDTPLSGANQAYLLINQGEYGWYSVFITTSYGCAVFSEPFLVCPTVEITVSEDQTTLSVPEGYASYQWVQNGIPVTGANQNTFEPTGGNSYWVIITTEYGCQISTTPIVSSVSVEEQVLETASIVLYPNPATDGFNVRFNSSSSASVNISLVDMSGKTVQDYGEHSSGNLGQQWFSLRGVSTGTYLVVFSNQTEKTSTRIVVR